MILYGDFNKFFIKTFVEACRLGILQKTSRRPLEEERQSLAPGSVFVYDEAEAGIKRWTDGKLWSPSRIYGDFLLYQELESRLNHIKKYEDLEENIRERIQKENKKFHVSNKGTFVYSNEGLVKKTISANVEGSIQHMIIYEDKQGHHDDLYPPQAYVELSNIIPSSIITKSGVLRKATASSKVGNSKYSLPKIQVGIRPNNEENGENRNDNQFMDNQFKGVLPGTICCHNKPIILREPLIPPSLPPLPDTINPQYFEKVYAKERFNDKFTIFFV
ncbi:24177_t:CDS:2 [Gigaspora margarita]|uniref:24177_t:CDS:1 n=1 Tax=Gigaspora margarita TaxID=4874 RepID=A0ABM8W1Y8_GIGMA|nr:24177_t:CDS:2 [Gigaspora margarita]